MPPKPEQQNAGKIAYQATPPRTPVFDEPRYFILSMDGATPEGGGYVTAGILRHMWQCLQKGSCDDHNEDSTGGRVSFLNFGGKDIGKAARNARKGNPEHEDRRMIFAGTSSGAWSALYLASHENPDDVLKCQMEDPCSLISFWARATDAMSPHNSSLSRLAKATLGQCSYASNDRLKAVLLTCKSS